MVTGIESVGKIQKWAYLHGSHTPPTARGSLLRPRRRLACGGFIWKQGRMPGVEGGGLGWRAVWVWADTPPMGTHVQT